MVHNNAVRILSNYLKNIKQKDSDNCNLNKCKKPNSGKSQQRIWICDDKVFKGPPKEFKPRIEFAEQSNCIKLDPTTMNLLIQSVIKTLKEKNPHKFGNIEHYDKICNDDGGYYLESKRYKYCPFSKDSDSALTESSSSESVMSSLETEKLALDTCYGPLDEYLKSFSPEMTDQKELEKLFEFLKKIIENIFIKLDYLFDTIQFHHCDPKAHQIFLNGSGTGDISSILGDLDKVTFTLNIENEVYRIRINRGEDRISNLIKTIGTKTNIGVHSTDYMRFECFPRENNNIEKLGFLASICILSPHKLSNDIREFGLRLIYEGKLPKSNQDTLKEFTKTNLKLTLKEKDSLGKIFSFIEIKPASNNLNKTLKTNVILMNNSLSVKDSPTASSRGSPSRTSPPRSSPSKTSPSRSSLSRRSPSRSSPSRRSLSRESPSRRSPSAKLEKRYVLWIRHCQACHNIESNFQEQPLCTKQGIAEAYEFGKNFKKIKQSIEKEIIPKEVSYKMFSSVLTRAMETAKIITHNRELWKKENEIYRINNIQELESGYINQNQNTITLKQSNDSCEFLNRYIENTQRINCSDIIGLDPTTNKDHKFIINNKSDLKENYENFKENLFRDEKFKNEHQEDQINCIVSHSAFIKMAMNLKHRLNNLDAILCIYTKDDEGDIIEEKKYLFLLEKLVGRDSEKLYYDLEDRDINNIIKIEKGIFKNKTRYGKIKSKDLEMNEGDTYANKVLFKGHDKFKNCNYKTDELTIRPKPTKFSAMSNQSYLTLAPPELSVQAMGGNKKTKRKRNNKRIKLTKKRRTINNKKKSKRNKRTKRR